MLVVSRIVFCAVMAFISVSCKHAQQSSVKASKQTIKSKHVYQFTNSDKKSTLFVIDNQEIVYGVLLGKTWENTGTGLFEKDPTKLKIVNNVVYGASSHFVNGDNKLQVDCLRLDNDSRELPTSVWNSLKQKTKDKFGGYEGYYGIVYYHPDIRKGELAVVGAWINKNTMIHVMLITDNKDLEGGRKIVKLVARNVTELAISEKAKP